MQQSKDKFTDFLGMSDIIVFLINLFVIYRVIFSGLDVNSFLLIFFLQILLSAMFNLVKVLSKKPEKVAMNNTISSFLFIAMFIITCLLFLGKALPQGIFNLISQNSLSLIVLISGDIISLIYFWFNKDSFAMESTKRIFYYDFAKTIFLIVAGVYMVIAQHGTTTNLALLVGVKIISDLTFGRSKYVQAKPNKNL